ncbi:AEC family transporter [Prochlorococcus marinus]|uniref:AEC family transporter n=1 Tax=Prochlorococcus marinus TaxID=1219 RepID=UPI0022B4198E|nr:AEC family transporter [Prochlorococcus marinus]
MNILNLITELIPCLFLGYLIGQFDQNISTRVAKPLSEFGIPISLMGLLLNTGIDWNLLEAAFIGLLAIGILIVTLIIYQKYRKVFLNSILLLGSTFGNTGYFGIPISLSLLPTEALSFSMGFDIGATLLIWTVGPFIIGDADKKLTILEKFKVFLGHITKSPASKGLLGFLIISITPWDKPIASILWIPSKIVIFLALLIVGMRLGVLNPFKKATITKEFQTVKNSLLTKLILFPTLMLGICLSIGMNNIMRNALVLQAAAPTALSILLIAESSERNQDIARSLVVWSTLSSLITIPIWSFVLQIIN